MLAIHPVINDLEKLSPHSYGDLEVRYGMDFVSLAKWVVQETVRQGLDPFYVYGLLLKQLAYKALLHSSPLTRIYEWAESLGFSEESTEAIINEAKSKLVAQDLDKSSALSNRLAVQSPILADSPSISTHVLDESGFGAGSQGYAKEQRETESDSIRRVAEEIAEGFASEFKGIEVVGYCNKGLVCSKFVFRKPLKVGFDQLANRLKEALSNAGIDPGIGASLVYGKRNQFEIHVPKPKEEWAVLEFPKKKLHLPPPPMDLDLQAPVMVDLEGKPFRVRLTSGCLIVGAPNTGKSNALKTICLSLAQWYGYKNLKIAAAFDMKDGLALSALNGSPWMDWTDVDSNLNSPSTFSSSEGDGVRSVSQLNQPNPYSSKEDKDLLLSGDLWEENNGDDSRLVSVSADLCSSNNCTDELDYVGLGRKGLGNGSRRMNFTFSSDDPDLQTKAELWFEEVLIPEKERRAKLFRDARVEKIQEYNAKFPYNPLFWAPLFIDEIALVGELAGEKVKSYIDEVILRWRCYGFPVICTTHYSDQKMGLPPAIRAGFQSSIVFRSSHQTAKMAFGEDSNWAKEAGRLAGHGDCVVKQGGDYIRGWSIYTPSETFYELMH